MPKQKSKKTKAMDEDNLNSDSDPLFLFYTSLLRQNPKSEMAIRWCMKHKCHDHLDEYADRKVWSTVEKNEKGKGKNIHMTAKTTHTKTKNKTQSIAPTGVKAVSTVRSTIPSEQKHQSKNSKKSKQSKEIDLDQSFGELLSLWRKTSRKK